MALLSFFPTKGEGAIGSLDWTEEERKLYAKKYLFLSFSLSFSPRFFIAPPSLQVSDVEVPDLCVKGWPRASQDNCG